MACRLVNLHSKPLRIDLRGGRVLVLAPGERSAVLREELLYDNHHVPDWERLGWIRRFAARLGDVTAVATMAVEKAPPKPPHAAPKKPESRRSK